VAADTGARTKNHDDGPDQPVQENQAPVPHGEHWHEGATIGSCWFMYREGERPAGEEDSQSERQAGEERLCW
jgi:hypothetical protein